MESMRLYPPSWAIGRQTIQDYSLNEKYSIPSGSVIIMSQYLLHHDARVTFQILKSLFRKDGLQNLRPQCQDLAIFRLEGVLDHV